MADFDIDISIDDEIDVDVEFENIVIQGSGGDPVTVENSDDTYSQQQACGTKHELPDVNHTDSDGSPTVLPGMTPMVCAIDIARILDFEFGAAGDDVISRIIGANQAATYTINTLTNIDTVVYKVNAVVKVLPFSVVNTDTLEVTITRTLAATLSRVVLTGA